MARTHMYTTVTSQRPGNAPHAPLHCAVNALPFIQSLFGPCALPAPASRSCIPDIQYSESYPSLLPRSEVTAFKEGHFSIPPTKIPLLFDGAAGELITIPIIICPSLWYWFSRRLKNCLVQFLKTQTPPKLLRSGLCIHLAKCIWSDFMFLELLTSNHKAENRATPRGSWPIGTVLCHSDRYGNSTSM